ncbi:MAG: CRTAC1 family protein, partial [candidate division Zixibacteria bacterium]|nr:CRTAC1 family protein [candidate division Zixibacteria bacterium]
SGSNWGDYDNDGDLDLYVTNYYFGNPNSLYENQGDGTFTIITGQDIAADVGWSTSSCWADLNNDGYLDMYVVQDEYGVASSDCIYINDGAGGFSRVVDLDFADHPGKTTKVSAADYDRDGDLDLFLCSSYGDEPNVLYENHNNDQGNWVIIKCVGTESNRSAIGAKVRIKATFDSSPQWQLREINPQTGGFSKSSINAHFGLDDAVIIDSILIEWPSGINDTLSNISINQYLTVTEGDYSDFDEDGFLGYIDNCPIEYNPGQEDGDSDGLGDDCDNCPDDFNPNQEDSDKDNIGDICEWDCGDVDGTPDINILDIVFLINYKYKSGPAPDPLESADVN